ncbi:MAG: pantetheine-phosphate adenylyltransferase [Gammaproteobacteria bacterium]|jgi:pantetheine-phosphate adenylyltransferase|uniref:Phosphopantetheine adenylyltransferase n=1 Tax=SAR86 cluster bacterium SAR86B TaxID=1123867 RepID=J5KH12_9GAMM|nr:MAG: pantetheine-phosphate adenylyltransferase [SAR86 cluster bacterium SAR86B]|tara:strand:- start:154 stop:639 length:486 start_codon:yes stop_codon:yes gene_type:complete
MKVAIYPGSFDPITLGHMDIIDRACYLFDKVIVAIAKSESKNPLFSLEERIKLTETIYKDHPKVEVVGFPRKLTVDLARDYGASAIVRGLRAVADFEYEFQLATMNRALAPDIESIFLTPKESLIYVSSSLIKEIADLKGNISNFVHPVVESALVAKLDNS